MAEVDIRRPIRSTGLPNRACPVELESQVMALGLAQDEIQTELEERGAYLGGQFPEDLDVPVVNGRLWRRWGNPLEHFEELSMIAGHLDRLD